MKRTLLMIGLVACGAPDDDGLALGQLEQEFGAKATPSYQYGTQLRPSHLRCSRTLATQVCRVPSTKSQTWCAVTPGHVTAVTQVIAGFDAVPGWTFTGAALESGLCPVTARNLTIIFQGDGCGNSGTAGSNIANFACVSPGPGTGLSEGPGVVGSYESQARCVALVDYSQLSAKTANATILDRYVRQATAHAVAACLGIGLQTTQEGYASSQTFTGGQAFTGLTSGELCAMTSYTLADVGAFHLVTPDCAAD